MTDQNPTEVAANASVNVNVNETRSNLPTQDFIVQWEGAENIDAFCKATGLKKSSAQARATRIRSEMGLPLKTMKQGPKDIGELKELLAGLQGRTVEELDAQAAKDKVRRADIAAKRQHTMEQNASS